ncbi:hypothetical protein B0H67DRAFT_641662 [Lasiosphaeris hirsuta]|uniref:Uncharacterized protein n=1 Tax=Lasiosphaeris hirsuta TaxID=260670 RepID=A0AA40B069_9PEZI|nr:hypothetical protein B0H67DRAFT_641662 [Lasiosphaeris hirsuta]
MPSFSLFKPTPKPTPATTQDTTTTPQEPPKEKKSLYQRYWEAKNGRNKTISEADLVQYTGKTKAELAEWAADRPGVGGNRLAGTLAMGTTTGLGGMSFPPPQKGGGKKVDDSEEDA